MKKQNLLLALASLTMVVGCKNNHPSDSDSINSEQNPSTSQSASSTSSEESSSTTSESTESSNSSAVGSIIAVSTITRNDSFVNFDANRSEKTNKQIEFINKDCTYKVGDDNPINLLPNTTFLEKDLATGEIRNVEVDKWDYKINISYKKDEKYVAISDELKFIDSIDYQKCLVDFSSNAIGNSFKVDIIPENLTNKQLNEIGKYTVSMEFDVVDGFNCYDSKELAYINNSNDTLHYMDYYADKTEATAWTKFKKANNLLEDYYPTRIILQKNISITANDIPVEYTYLKEEVSSADGDYKRVVGSLKDYNTIYNRMLADNEEFEIEGNYFSLDASKIPLVIRESNKITEEGKVVSHATFLRVSGATTATTGVRNTNLIGNAPRQENTTLSGGIIFNKTNETSFTASNNLAVCWFITYMPNNTFQKYLINDCKAYDNFNSFIYNWGSPDVEVNNCEFIGAGGPVVIQDHIHSTDADGGTAPKTVVNNSILESYVAGSEGWFSVVHAEQAAAQIKGLDQLFNAYGKSFLKNSGQEDKITYINFICINKSGDSQSPTASKVSGEFTMNNYVSNYGEGSVLKQFFDTTFSMGAPAFQTSAGGYSYTDGKTGLFDATNSLITDPTNNMLNGDTITIYFQGMMIVLGNYHSYVLE